LILVTTTPAFIPPKTFTTVRRLLLGFILWSPFFCLSCPRRSQDCKAEKEREVTQIENMAIGNSPVFHSLTNHASCGCWVHPDSLTSPGRPTAWARLRRRCPCLPLRLSKFRIQQGTFHFNILRCTSDKWWWALHRIVCSK